MEKTKIKNSLEAKNCDLTEPLNHVKLYQSSTSLKFKTLNQ